MNSDKNTTAPLNHQTTNASSNVLTKRLLESLGYTVAEGGTAALLVAGRSRPHLVDGAASTAIETALELHSANTLFRSVMSEGRKDHAPMFDEGETVGERGGVSLDVLSDPVECTNQLACAPNRRRRASMSLVALAPKDSIKTVDSDGYARKLVFPPGVPTGKSGIQIDTPIPEVVSILCKHFGCKPHDLEVAILERDYNDAAALEFYKQKVKVRLYPSGDFEEGLLAACPVSGNDRIRFAYSTGGRTEGFLTVPFVRMTGASQLYQLVSKRTKLPEKNDNLVLTADEMIRSDDCVLAVAAITDARDSHLEELDLVPIRQMGNGVYVVRVMLASPRWSACRFMNVVVVRRSQRVRRRQ